VLLAFLWVLPGEEQRDDGGDSEGGGNRATGPVPEKVLALHDGGKGGKDEEVEVAEEEKPCKRGKDGKGTKDGQQAARADAPPRTAAGGGTAAAAGPWGCVWPTAAAAAGAWPPLSATAAARRCQAAMSANEKRDLDLMFRQQERHGGRPSHLADLARAQQARQRQRQRKEARPPVSSAGTGTASEEISGLGDYTAESLASWLLEEEAVAAPSPVGASPKKPRRRPRRRPRVAVVEEPGEAVPESTEVAPGSEEGPTPEAAGAEGEEPSAGEPTSLAPELVEASEDRALEPEEDPPPLATEEDGKSNEVVEEPSAEAEETCTADADAVTTGTPTLLEASSQFADHSLSAPPASRRTAAVCDAAVQTEAPTLAAHAEDHPIVNKQAPPRPARPSAGAGREAAVESSPEAVTTSPVVGAASESASVRTAGLGAVGLSTGGWRQRAWADLTDTSDDEYVQPRSGAYPSPELEVALVKADAPEAAGVPFGVEESRESDQEHGAPGPAVAGLSGPVAICRAGEESPEPACTQELTEVPEPEDTPEPAVEEEQADVHEVAEAPKDRIAIKAIASGGGRSKVEDGWVKVRTKKPRRGVAAATKS